MLYFIEHKTSIPHGRTNSACPKAKRLAGACRKEMRMRHFKKFFSIILTLSMVISLFAGVGPAVSADNSGQKLEAVTSLEAGGQYIITATYNGTTYALSYENASDAVSALRAGDIIAVSNNETTADLSKITWTYTSSQTLVNGTYGLRMTSSALYTNGTASAFTYDGTTLSSNGYAVEFGYCIKDNVNTYCFGRTSGSYMYAVSGAPSIVVYKLVSDSDSSGGDEQVEPASPDYYRLTPITKADYAQGKQYMIAGNILGMGWYAMSSAQVNGGRLAGVSVHQGTEDGGIVIYSDDDLTGCIWEYYYLPDVGFCLSNVQDQTAPIITTTANSSSSTLAVLHINDEINPSISRYALEGFILYPNEAFGASSMTDGAVAAQVYEVEACSGELPAFVSQYTVTFQTANAVAKVNNLAVTTVTVDEGTDISFSVTPDEGYELDAVTVSGGTLTGSAGSYTLSNITGNVTVTVNAGETAPEEEVGVLYTSDYKLSKVTEFVSGAQYVILSSNNMAMNTNQYGSGYTSTGNPLGFQGTALSLADTQAAAAAAMPDGVLWTYTGSALTNSGVTLSYYNYGLEDKGSSTLNQTNFTFDSAGSLMAGSNYVMFNPNSASGYFVITPYNQMNATVWRAEELKTAEVPNEYTVSFEITGDGNAAVEIDGSPITGDTVKAAGGETITFTLALDGVRVEYVKAGTEVIYANADGGYSMVVSGDITVTVKTAKITASAAVAEAPVSSLTAGKQYIITYTTGGTVYAVSAEDGEYSYTRKAVPVTVSGDTVTAADDISALLWDCTDEHYLTNGGLYLYGGDGTISSTSSSLNLGSVASVWTLDGGKLYSQRHSAYPAYYIYYLTESGAFTGTASASIGVSVDVYEVIVENPETYTVTFTTDGGALVSGEVIGEDYTAVVERGGSLAFTVEPADGCRVAYVTATSGTLTESSGSYILSGVTADTTVTIATARGYTVTFTTDGHAEVSGEIDENKAYVQVGTDFSFTVTAAAGYLIDSVTAGEETLTPDSDGRYTLTVTSDVTVTVTTKEAPSADEDIEPWDGVTTEEPALQGGYYMIGTGAELAWFAAKVNSGYKYANLNAKLTADINLGYEPWTPIGNYLSSSTVEYNHVYSGTFDGNGHKIVGLNPAQTKVYGTMTVTGLFGVAAGATIKNLAVYGTVTGYTGNGAGYSGGFVALAFGVTMDQCANHAAVTGQNAGGLIGYVYPNSFGGLSRSAVSITNSYNDGGVTGTKYAGGFIGYLGGGDGSDSVSYGFNYGALSGGSTGAIYGLASAQPDVENFYCLLGQGQQTQKTAEEFKSLVSDNCLSRFVFIDGEEHPALLWEVSESTHMHTYGGFVDNGDGTHTGYCTVDNTPITEEHVLNADGQCVYCGYLEQGSKLKPYEISTAAELQALADEVNSGDSKAGIYYVLTGDIDAGEFTPIGHYDSTSYSEMAFSGHFDGQGHTITVNISDSTGSNARVGLFGSVVGSADEHAEVKNLIVAGTVRTVNGGSCVAGLAGYARNADITNCGNAAGVINEQISNGTGAANGAAGILGRSGGNVTVTGCFNVGTVSADMYAAGIVYDAAAVTAVSSCYDMGTLSAAADGGYVGGIVAVPNVGVSVSVSNSYAAGSYTGDHIGAIIGTISQTLDTDTVYYQGESWLGSSNDNGWSQSHTEPASFSDYSSLAAELGDSFRYESGYPYALLAWQDGPAAPSYVHVHTYSVVVTPASCSERGYTTHTCTGCGFQYVDSYVPALGHDLVVVSNGNGTHTTYCSRGDVDPVVENCVYDEGKVTLSPTRTEPGTRTYTCGVCGYQYDEEIAPNDFDLDAEGNYLINSSADLERLAEKVGAGNSYEGATFILTADVTLTTPIGAGESTPFKGAFDGGYHAVTLSINDDGNYSGMFAFLSGATVEKLIVRGEVNGGGSTGGIAGYASKSVIRYCGNEAVINGSGYVGGLVGVISSSSVTACYNKGSVTNNAVDYICTGGITGVLSNAGTIEYCYNTGAVTAISGAGEQWSSGEYWSIGGIVGEIYSCYIKNCYSVGTLTGGEGSSIGGVIGYSSDSNAVYSTASTHSYYLESAANAADGRTGTDSAYISSAASDDLKSINSTAGQNLGAYYIDDDSGINDGYLLLSWEVNQDSADGSKMLRIYTKQDLEEFRNSINTGTTYEGWTVCLMNDIDLEGEFTEAYGGHGSNIWTTIGGMSGGTIDHAFYGTFDGQGHTISNMVLMNSASGYQGLFAILPEGAAVRNLTVTGTIDLTQSAAGSIVGWNLGTVENCVSYVNINAPSTQFVGGIVADNAGAVIGCVNYGTVASYEYVGGIAGHCEPAYDSGGNAITTPVIENCVNNGAVTGSYEYVGGIVGGSFSEDGPGASILGCVNNGSVTGQWYTGGIAGYMSSDSFYYDNFIAIKNCYNTGAVKSTVYAGGIVGYIGQREAQILNCYTSGSINGLYNSGVFAGYCTAQVLNSYYLASSGSEADSGTELPDSGAVPAEALQLRSDWMVEKLGAGYKQTTGYPALYWENSDTSDTVTVSYTDNNTTYNTLEKTGSTISLPANIFDGSAGWTVNGGEYAAGDSLTVTADTTVISATAGSAAGSVPGLSKSFSVYVTVGENSVRLKSYSPLEMLELYDEENGAGALKYSAVTSGGYYAGRAVTEYVPLAELLSDAGAVWESGASLKMGGGTYTYDELSGTARYYYYGTEGVEVPAIIAIQSYGGKTSSDSTLDTWLDYTDYLYAYMLTYGQATAAEETYGGFVYQQEGASVVYGADEQANATLKALLEETIAQGISEGKDVTAAQAVLSDESATNGAVMSAILEVYPDKAEEVPEGGTDTYERGVGDINDDGKINAVDAMLILRYVAGTISLADVPDGIADVNGDGFINTADALRILWYSIGRITSFG